MTATEELKTKAQLLADIDRLFPDQDDEAITPERARDFFKDVVHAAFGSNGMLYTTSALAVATSSAAAPAVITGFHQGDGADLLLSTANGTITIPTGGDGGYHVGFMASVNPSASLTAIDWTIHRNGVATPGYATAVAQTVGGIQLFTVTLCAMARLPLAAGDVLDIRQRNGTGAATLNSWIQFWATRQAG